MRIGFVGGAYIAESIALANEECINWFQGTVESQGAIVPTKAYGGSTAQSIKGLLRTPGISVFANGLPGVPRAQLEAGGRYFVVAGAQLVEISAAGVQTNRGAVVNDANPASMAYNGLQILVVSGGHAYCFTLATNVLLEVTGDLAATPLQCDYSDTYFIVSFSDSNKYQMSQVLDGTTWPGQLVNEVSVFAGNIRSIICNHRELWVFGDRRGQPFQDTGSAEVFDPIGGTMLEVGSAATFSVCRVDNSIFWISEDERGARMAWRSNGYSPQRISTHAVEIDLASYASIAGLTSYAYQDGGHLFWVLYVPGSSWSWVYDVGEQLWHKRAKWTGVGYAAHWGWNHAYVFGKHLVGDWNSAAIYQLSMANLTDNGTTIRRLRRPPHVMDEMQWIVHAEMTIDFEPGLGPQPPLKDGKGNARAPQAMLRWSDNRGRTWSNEHWAGIGQAGQYNARAIWRRLGRSRYRVYELVVTDPIAWAIVDAYLKTA